MIGKNTLTFSAESMQEIVQHYLDTVMLKSKSLRVLAVRQESVSGGGFIVSVEATDEEGEETT